MEDSEEARDTRGSRRRVLDENPVVKRLKESPHYNEILRLLNKHTRRFKDRSSPMYDFRTNDEFICDAAVEGMAGPDLTERMTAGERRKAAATIINGCNAVWSALAPLFAERMPDEFQFEFDQLAKNIAYSEADRLRDGVKFGEEGITRCWSAAYSFLMEDLESLFLAIGAAADQWRNQESILKKPNDSNAARLYFIRKVSKRMYLGFGLPLREATLALTSVYFACDDLNEADLSKIAPHYKPHLPQSSGEDYERLREYLANLGIDLDAIYLDQNRPDHA
jgi:hypothetical protein